MTTKLAFCFLIYDTIQCEELWNIFFKNVPSEKYTIYIHYKTQKPLKYFEDKKLKHCIETRHGDISLVKAQNILLQEALKDEANEHCIFVSGTCVPLKSFDVVYKSFSKDFSYFNICPQSQCFPRCTKTLTLLERRNIQKAHQWCILNRKHAQLMLDTTDYLEWFSYPETVPDEHCYISNLYFHKLQNELITTNNSASDATTFTNWCGTAYKYPSLRALKNYESITKEELLYLLASKSLFGRKFLRESIVCFTNKDYLTCISSAPLRGISPPSTPYKETQEYR